VEEWIKKNPEFLREDLLIIGQQVPFPELANDRIDLLALDAEARLVIIEVKRGTTPSDVDLQVLKYVSYMSDKTPEDFMEIARRFYECPENRGFRQHLVNERVDPLSEETTLEQSLAAHFGNEADFYTEKLEEAANRIIIVAEDFDPRIALVISWLSRQGVLIRGIRYTRYVVDGNTFLLSEQYVPSISAESELRTKTGLRPRTEGEWKVDGEKYHRRKLPPQTLARFDQLVQALGSSLRNIQWNQKYYAWLIGSADRRLLWHTYLKGRIDLGFSGLSEQDARDYVSRHGLSPDAVKLSQGYPRSPFYQIAVDKDPDANVVVMLKDWLDGR